MQPPPAPQPRRRGDAPPPATPGCARSRSGAAVARLGAAVGIAPEGVALALAFVIAGALLIVAGLRAPGALVHLESPDPERFRRRAARRGASGDGSDAGDQLT